MTRVCVVDDGAAAGVIAARIASKGLADVSMVARDAHLAAVRATGLRVTCVQGEIVAPVTATDDAATLGPQDYVLLAVGAGSLPAEIGELSSLIGAETCVLTVQPGVPWWYFHRHPGPFENLTIDAIDPLGRIWETIGPDRVLGFATEIAADLVAPGVIAHRSGTSVIIGEPSGDVTTRARILAELLTASGLDACVSPAIRPHIWAALCTNFEAMIRHRTPDATDTLAGGVAQEIIAIAAKLGNDRTAIMSGAKPRLVAASEAPITRPKDFATDIAALLELGRLVECETPHLDRLEGSLDLSSMPVPE